VPVNIICDSISVLVPYFASRLSVLILVTYNCDKFLIQVHSIFNRQLGLYVNMLISLYFLLLSYCQLFHCVVRVVLGVTNELYVFLLCCLILCACPRWPWLCDSA
jgi:hypothetical protein